MQKPLNLSCDRFALSSLPANSPHISSLRYGLKRLLMALAGFSMATACTAQTTDNQTAQTTTAPETPVLAQASPKPTTPEYIPILELKPATQRQKDILSRMPESGYSQIPRELIRVAEVDLNNDGSPEFIATFKQSVNFSSGQCGNRGCPLTIYSNIQGRWRKIYSILGGHPIKVDSAVTNGYRNILIKPNGLALGLTFNGGKYSHTYFQDGSIRITAFSDHNLSVPASAIFYTRPTRESPRRQYPGGSERPSIVGRIDDWYLVRGTSYAFAGWYAYVPVEVVDGRRSTSGESLMANTPQTADLSKIRSELRTYTKLGKFSIKYPSDWTVQSAGDDGNSMTMTNYPVTSINEYKFNPNHMKVEIYFFIPESSFQQLVNESLNPNPRYSFDRIIKHGRTKIDGREAYQIWYEALQNVNFTNYVETLIENGGRNSAKIIVYYNSENASAPEIAQMINGSFRALK